jgi:N12 class adenine-specific DNA methylase
VTVVSDDIASDVTRAVTAAGTALVPMTDAPASELAPLDVITDDEDGRKENSFHIIDGALNVIVGGQATPVKENAELRALVTLRDAAVTLVETEAQPHATDAELAVPRATAYDLYQAYVQKFGALNRGTLVEGKPDTESGDPTYTWRRPRLGGFRQDPDYVTVMALEEFDQETGAAAPAPILLRRVNHTRTRIEHVETAPEALAVSLGETGTVKLTRIASLLGLPGTTQALDALGDLVYLDHGVPVAAATYLSGNVRQRLADARQQAATDPAYQRNVTALEQVLPAPLGAQDVKVKLGVPWIPASDVAQFAKDELECHWPEIKYTAAAAVWEADGSMSSNALAKYGTARVHTMRILEHALNGTSPIVMDDVSRGDKKVRVRNNEETIAAEDKLRSMNERFAVWVWEDGERATRLLAEYNRRFNSHVIRPLDGSYLTFPGLNDAITPWQHQRNAVDLIVSTDRALIAHPVGAGKTKSMILAALTLRRFGLAKKPLITVPKHLLEQIVREAQQAYPTARFLIAGEDDLRGDNRRLFAARAATGDWDAIVMTHQAFTSLPVSPEAEARWVEQQKMELREAMDRDDQHSRGAKAVAKALRNLQARLQQLRHGVQDDTGVLFEHLVDHDVTRQRLRVRLIQARLRPAAEGRNPGTPPPRQAHRRRVHRHPVGELPR